MSESLVKEATFYFVLQKRNSYLHKLINEIESVQTGLGSFVRVCFTEINLPKLSEIVESEAFQFLPACFLSNPI